MIISINLNTGRSFYDKLQYKKQISNSFKITINK
jgi:hypothetical protein